MTISPFFVYAVLGFILQTEFSYAMTRIFTMRSNALYYALFVADFLMNLTLLALDVRIPILTLPLAILWLFTPFLLSYGSVRKRLTRSIFAYLVIGAIEALGSLVYVLLSGSENMPYSPYDMDPATVVGTYFILITLAGIALEGLIIMYARIDQRQDQEEAHVETPVLIFMFSASLLSGIVYNSLVSINSSSVVAPTLFAYALVSMAFGIALLLVSRREYRARLEEVRRDAKLRQVDQLRRMVSADARRIGATRRLRHDLANQVSVVRQLATRGELAEADRYLAQLQNQARIVAEGTHE